VAPLLRDGWLRLILTPLPTKLTYSVTPAAVACSPSAEHPVAAILQIDAYNASSDPQTIAKIAVQVPADLTTDPDAVRPAVFVPGDPVAPGEILMIPLPSMAISTVPGESKVKIYETVGTESESVELTVIKVGKPAAGRP
jgi:hypothetical protein